MRGVMCVAPGCSGAEDRVSTGWEERSPRQTRRLWSYHFVLGRLENTNSHLVGSYATHKVTSYEHALLTIWGKTGDNVLEALFLSIHIKGNHRIKICVFKGTPTLAIKKKYHIYKKQNYSQSG